MTNSVTEATCGNDKALASNIIHRIHKNGPPIKARRLLPGSDKAIKAKKAWDELISFGIVEKVDPAKSNTICSPLHFAQKPYGSLRPVGDLRLPNLQREINFLFHMFGILLNTLLDAHCSARLISERHLTP